MQSPERDSNTMAMSVIFILAMWRREHGVVIKRDGVGILMGTDNQKIIPLHPSLSVVIFWTTPPTPCNWSKSKLLSKQHINTYLVSSSHYQEIDQMIKLSIKAKFKSIV